MVSLFRNRAISGTIMVSLFPTSSGCQNRFRGLHLVPFSPTPAYSSESASLSELCSDIGAAASRRRNTASKSGSPSSRPCRIASW